MSSLFTHIFIPLVILLLFSKKLGIDTKKVLALSFFGALPDADHLFLSDRASLHNIFLLMIPLLLFILMKSKREVIGIICFYLASHIVLDLLNGGVFLLHPVYDKAFFMNAGVIFDNGSIKSAIDYGISSKITGGLKGRPVISSENTGIMILLVVCGVISAVRKWKNSAVVKY